MTICFINSLAFGRHIYIRLVGEKMIVPFNYIKINHTEIDQEILNIENRTRTNLFAWNGQFSPQFIEAMLSKYVNTNDIVYDPFLGSGTTLYECARKNITALGTELNPSAYYISKVYELSNLNSSQRCVLIDTIDELLHNIETEADIIPIITAQINEHASSTYSNVLSLLIVLFDIFNNELTLTLAALKWQKLKEIIVKLPFSSSVISVFLGDSRKSGLNDDSINVVLTSPPYINVFNYHQKYRRSVEALGFDVLSIAKQEFGSNRKNRGNRFLTVIQYCIDMALSIRELIRIGKNDARFILVVGKESQVLSFAFCNSELVYRIGSEILGLKFLLKQQRCFKNRFGQLIYEDILHFENNKIACEKLKEIDIINQARKIAKNYLDQKSKGTDDTNKNYNLLISAINDAEKVNASEE